MARALTAWIRVIWIPVLLGSLAPRAQAAEAEAQFIGPYPGTVSWQTGMGFHEIVGRLQKAVTANGLTVAYTQSTNGAGHVRATLVLVTGRGMAERMIAADSLAGMEVPIRFWIVEDGDHQATLVYRTPSSILAIYDNRDLDVLGAELDQVFAKIVDEAIND